MTQQIPEKTYTTDEIRTLSALRPSNKKHREQMVAHLRTLAAHYNASLTAGPAPLEPNSVTVRIGLAPAYVGIHLDSKRSRATAHNLFGHWNIEIGNPTRFAASFALAISGTVNPYHAQKATQHAYGFGLLLVGLSRALHAIGSGTAFLPPAAPEGITAAPSAPAAAL